MRFATLNEQLRFQADLNYTRLCGTNHTVADPVNANYRIVVIEDEPAIRNLYQLKLEMEGFAVQTACDGISGLELAEAFRPHLLLLDIRMPEMNGDEMLLRLREQDWGASMRAVVLTNISRDEAPSVLRFLNVDRYIVKAHYTPAQVVEIVREVLHIK